MNRNHAVQEQVEHTLSELDSLRRVNADPFFYTRLKARIVSEGARQRRLAGFWGWPGLFC